MEFDQPIQVLFVANCLCVRPFPCHMWVCTNFTRFTNRLQTIRAAFQLEIKEIKKKLKFIVIKLESSLENRAGHRATATAPTFAFLPLILRIRFR